MDINRRKLRGKFTLAYLVWLIATFWLLRTILAPTPPRNVSYSEFLAEVKAGHLEEVRINQRQLVGTLKKDQQKKDQHNKKDVNPRISCARIPGLDAGPLVRELEAQHVKFSGNIPAPSWWSGLLIAWGPMLLLVLVYILAMRKIKQGGGPLSFGKNRAKIHDESKRFDTSFADVAGLEEAKGELWEIVDFLKTPQKYQKLGGRIPRGVLLVGAPGTGKTLLARAVAGEASVPFFSISGSEFVEIFVGVGASRVRDLFEEAKKRAPCIIFIDELDAIGKSRSAGRVLISNEEREQTLNQLLVELDGFDPSKGVIIMAATNTPEVLDVALLRPGRFDRQIVLDRPDVKEREAILRLHTSKLKISPEVNLQRVAAETPGMVGADLANIVNEAALNAARRNADQIELRDFEQAVDRVTLGSERRGHLIRPEERKRVAYHEVGHALVALSVPKADPIRRISIIPRSIGALGHTLQLPGEDRYLQTQLELEDQLAVLLGGRGAEEIVFEGVVSTGASDDLARASELAHEMVTRFGMSAQMGNLTYGIPHRARYLDAPFESGEKNYSEHTAQQIDGEVRRIIDEQYARVKFILNQRSKELSFVAAALLQKETLQREDLDKILADPKLKQAA